MGLSIYGNNPSRHSRHPIFHLIVLSLFIHFTGHLLSSSSGEIEPGESLVSPEFIAMWCGKKSSACIIIQKAGFSMYHISSDYPACRIEKDSENVPGEQPAPVTPVSSPLVNDDRKPIHTVSPLSKSAIRVPMVNYTLNQDFKKGNITFTSTKTGQDPLTHSYAMTEHELTAGEHIVHTGLDLVNRRTYDITLQFTESAGNMTSFKITDVTFNSSDFVVTLHAPVEGSTLNTPVVRYHLSSDISSGDIVFTRTGGKNDDISPHLYSLSPGERVQGNHVVDTGAELKPDVIYTLTLEGFTSINGDMAHDVEVKDIRLNLLIPVIANTTPAPNTIMIRPAVSYLLNRTVKSGKVTFRRVDREKEAETHVYQFSPSDVTAGNHSINIGMELMNGAVYNVIFEIQDSDGVLTTITNEQVTFDDTSGVTIIVNPASNSRTSNAVVTYYVGDELSSGEILITRTGGRPDRMSPHRFPLTGEYLTPDEHTVDTGAVLMEGAIYSISLFNARDDFGNAIPGVSNINITFSSSVLDITKTKPYSNSVMTSTEVGYTLSSNASGVSITFTRTGGKPDPASPHSFTVSSGLSTGTHTQMTNLPLVDGAIYTVTFDAKDLIGHPATSLTNVMVYFDRNFGIGPLSDVDNTGSSRGRVDEADLAILTRAFGSRPGDPNWNPALDIDNGGTSRNVIDGDDLILLGSEYGKEGK